MNQEFGEENILNQEHFILEADIIQMQKNFIQDLIFLQYVNENNNWKLNTIGGGIYSFENMHQDSF